MAAIERKACDIGIKAGPVGSKDTDCGGWKDGHHIASGYIVTWDNLEVSETKET